MDIIKANQIIVFEINRLLRYYDMEDVDVYAYAINDVTHYKKGDHGYNMADWIDYIRINIAFAKTEDEIIHTTRHEFRHLWQNVMFPIESAYWFAWTRRILSDERLYHFLLWSLMQIALHLVTHNWMMQISLSAKLLKILNTIISFGSN